MDNHTDTSTTLSRSFETSIVQTVLRIPELDRLPGLRMLEARETHFSPFFETTKEGGKRAMETFERGIDHHRRQIRMGLFAMPLILFVQMQVRARLFVVSNQLLKTGIVHLA